MRKIKFILLILLIVVVGIVSIIISKNALPKTKGLLLKNQTVTSSINTSGILSYENIVTLTSEVSAKVDTIKFKVGDSVKQGDIIASFNNIESKITLEQAEIALSSARQNFESIKNEQLKTAEEDVIQTRAEYQKAIDMFNTEKKQYEQNTQIKDAQERVNQANFKYENKKIEFDRATKLYEQSAISKSELENKQYDLNLALSQYNMAMNEMDALVPDKAMKNAQYAVEMAQSKYKQAQNRRDSLREGGTAYQNALIKIKEAQTSVDNAVQKYNKSFIYAPFDGIIMERFIEPEEIANIGSKIVTLSRQGNLFLKATLDEKYSSKVLVGQKALVYPQGDTNALNGVIKRILPSVDSSKGVINIEIELLEYSDFLKNNMTVSVDIITSTFDNVIALGKEYIGGENGRTVWVVINKKVKNVNIEVLEDLGDRVIIKSGVVEGDALILPDALKVGTKTDVIFE